MQAIAREVSAKRYRAGGYWLFIINMQDKTIKLRWILGDSISEK